MTFSTDLLSHTQVLKLRKLFPARHILHNESTNSMLVKKGKRAAPHPPRRMQQECYQHYHPWRGQKTHQGARLTAGRQKGSKEMKREGKAVPRKSGSLGEQTDFCYFCSSFRFPSSTSCHQSHFSHRVLREMSVAFHFISKEYAI